MWKDGPPRGSSFEPGSGAGAGEPRPGSPTTSPSSPDAPSGRHADSPTTNRNSPGGASGRARYVLYWMQTSQRPWDNPALDLAVEHANALGLPVLVCFGLTAYPEATVRHYTFMLEGIAETAAALADRNIAFAMRYEEPWRLALHLSSAAALVVTDGAYLRLPRSWRSRLADRIDCPLYEVESDVVVPVRLASDKPEFAARTIRRKIHRQAERFLSEPVSTKVDVPAPPDLAGLHDTIAPDDPASALVEIERHQALDRGVPAVSRLYPGGPQTALDRFSRFLEHSLMYYSDHRNQPQTDDTSGMSMHLQYGQISPVRLLVEAARFRDSHGGESGRGSDVQQQYEDFYEELLVRRELAYNYCFYEPRYDSYEALPEWAKKTLAEHSHDERDPLYTIEELEAGGTEDEYWNACMKEMRETGYMHNYVRMYWGKQVLLWSATPEEAFNRLLYLNNRYFLDGLNPASYANVGWIFGLHDRPWTERAVFGKVRIMTPGGLKRKCDMPGYIAKVDRLAKFCRVG